MKKTIIFNFGLSLALVIIAIFLSLYYENNYEVVIDNCVIGEATMLDQQCIYKVHSEEMSLIIVWLLIFSFVQFILGIQEYSKGDEEKRKVKC